MINDIPQQGDLIWIDSEPHAGHEYGGHNPASNKTFRPLLVVSDKPTINEQDDCWLSNHPYD
ncbi:hypothetical protein [Lentilactobacillus parafarraginis]|uniref:hypothetical protein n=1 Tax=Lentilactobacillus parafarraginis TaxID=390842 RepID=UPI000AD92D86|nr:hypothetical protein [Lentilactobacillus parafarraginis]